MWNISWEGTFSFGLSLKSRGGMIYTYDIDEHTSLYIYVCWPFYSRKLVFLVLKLKLQSSHRWFKHAGESYVKIPFFGALSYLTLAVSPFCIAFAAVWAVYRNVSLAWIGQDILVRTYFLSFHLLSHKFSTFI